jgi:hypothetical protein
MRFVLLSAALAFVGATATVLFAQGPSAEEVENAQYLGIRSCRPCHMTAAQGEMYAKWEASKHAKAYETLASDESKAIAAALNIDNPQETAECLACHSTVGRVPESRVHPRFDKSEGVGCEACHGPGPYYRTIPVMCAISKGEIDGATVGLIAQDESVCAPCHTGVVPEGHPVLEFDFEEANAAIAHPLPPERAGGAACN